MPLRSSAFWLPRRGNSPAEYEDAFAAEDRTGRYALADGATESSFAAQWARLLVEDFVRSGADPPRWSDSLLPLQAQWDREVRARALPWYAEAGLEQGAFATLLAVVLTAGPESAWRWQAVAVGDTCLVHTRAGSLLRAFPLTASRHFGSIPHLVGSRMSPPSIAQRQNVWEAGLGQAGDRLWMMTDAAAQCCLAECESGRNPWNDLESILAAPSPDDRFAQWVATLRDAGKMRNDDVTLLAIPLD